MDTLALMRGLTEDHTSSDDDAPKSKVAPPRSSSAIRSRKLSGGRLEAPADPHDLIRGMTEDHWSSDDASAMPRGGTRARKRSQGARQRISSTSRERLPIGDPHGLVRGLTEDHPSSDDDGPSSTRTRNRLSSGAANRAEKPGGDPHDLIRGLTEDHWSSSDEAPQKPPPANTLKKPSLITTHHRPSSTTRPDIPIIGDPHDLIRGMTEDVWTSSDDEPAPSATRKTSTGSAKGRGSVLNPRKDSPTSPSSERKEIPAPGKAPAPVRSPPKPLSPSVLPLLPVGPNSPSNNQPPIRVLFVCLGNICRSPMAHGVLQHLTRPGLLPLQCPPVRVDSAGTGAYHASSPPDSRTMELLRMHGIKGFIHSARKIRTQDFFEWDYMLCMDAENLSDLKRRRKQLVDRAKDQGTPAGAGRQRALSGGGEKGGGRDRAPSTGRGRGEPKAKIQLFGEYGGNETEIVEDPYYGSNEGFDVAWEQVVRMAAGWIKAVLGFDADTSELLD